jgi:hypothetical protein
MKFLAGVSEKIILKGKEAEDAFRNFKKRLFIKTVLKMSPGSCGFTLLMALFTLQNLKKEKYAIERIVRYKEVLGSSENNARFVFKCFYSRSYDILYRHLFVENPQRYLQYIHIDGKEHVRRLLGQDTGVILISGHFGPNIRNLLFKEVFGIDAVAFVGPTYKEEIDTSSGKLYETLSLYKYYLVGEERQLQEGLKKNEWIVFLNDYPVKKRESNIQTLFGKRVYFSELPFKLALELNIPLLFFGTTRIKNQYQVSIMPLDNFKTKQEGLAKYISIVEDLLRRDPYASFFTATNQF